MSTLKKQEEEYFYKAYITEALQAIANNTAKYAGGSILKKSYMEILQEIKKSSSSSKESKQEKSSEETAEEVIARISLNFDSI